MKYQSDFTIVENKRLGAAYSLLVLRPEGDLRLPDMGILPGQFVQVQIPNNATFLRRPISVCQVDVSANHLWLLVRRAGKGTDALCDAPQGSVVNLLLPLGNGFTIPEGGESLLIGGGVGVAPLLYLGSRLDYLGQNASFLLGARSKKDLLLLESFSEVGDLYISTDDGTAGEKGLVTEHGILDSHFDRIYCCGPLPMMKAVAAYARRRGIPCEVSLENMMACGLGACLCCVEKTADGNNTCVCTDGPVFNIDKLQWNI